MKWNNAFTNTPPLTDGFPKPMTQQLFIKYKHKNTLPDDILYDSEIKTIGTFYKEDGFLFIIKGIGEVCFNDLEYCYWLDETPEDWDLLEKQFNEDFNTLTDKPTTGYDVIQWIKGKLRATN